MAETQPSTEPTRGSGTGPDAEMIRDAMRYRALRDLCESAVGASMRVNDHRLVYEEEPDPEIADGAACVVQWYPTTLIGFHTVGGATFDEMADAVVAMREGPTRRSYRSDA